MDKTLHTTDVFARTVAAINKGTRYVSSCGGTRSGKTYSFLQAIFLLHYGEEMRQGDGFITSIVSESMPHLKRGAIRDFKTILQAAGLWNNNRWSETDKSYHFSNGGLIEFFSVDNAGKVYGASRDRLFINEAQHIPFEIARQLFVRTRGQIFLDYNPTSSFWVDRIIEPRRECVTLHSTYKDNGFLSAEQVAEIESNRTDANWWKVFGEGQVGTLEGLVYSFELCDEMPLDGIRVYGMDFGFAADPTAIVEVIAEPAKKAAYLREICYRKGLINSDIVDVLQGEKTGISEVFADCAEPKSIEEIYRGGINVKPCTKSAPTKGSRLAFQLQWMQGWRLFVTRDSLNLINELRNYTWAQDKNGNKLNEPIDKFNHALDAVRYALYTKFGENGNKGNYFVR